MNDNNSLETNDYYENLNKHGNCSKCKIVLTQDNYRKEEAFVEYAIIIMFLHIIKINLILILLLKQMLALKQIFQMS